MAVKNAEPALAALFLGCCADPAALRLAALVVCEMRPVPTVALILD
jgi:hypothetical protein